VKSKRRVVRREEALARGNREPGQALTGAALSGVPLCEGLFQPDVLLEKGNGVEYGGRPALQRANRFDFKIGAPRLSGCRSPISSPQFFRTARAGACLPRPGNAILAGRVGHAYLFTGARGVGKTSAARIFGKALNCVQGPTPQPCNQCDVCLSIDAGEDVDVLEIDGASNRGIDEIRQIRSNVNIRPSRTPSTRCTSLTKSTC
jgi:hypothetical protein